MVRAPQLSGRRFFVLGLARSGLATLGFLERSGAIAIAWDTSDSARAQAQAQFPSVAFEPPETLALTALDGVILSPGVPLNRHPLAAAARAADIPILGDMELFQMARATLPRHKVVAITGTNGKSTTTALLHHLLEDAGRPARIGGNIGLPVLGQPPLPEGGTYVLELSSFQIDLCEHFAADIALYSNLTPDHLDRYDGMKGYAAAKERLFAMQRGGSDAVIAIDDAWTRRAAGRLPRGVRLHPVSARDIDPAEQRRWPHLQGPHNAQNVALATEAARILGLTEEEIEAGLESFAGLAHRMEIVGTFGGVTYVNDSKATNPTSVAPALQAFSNIHWILGGRAKTDELDACLPHLAHVKAAYLIGEATPVFAGLLNGRVPVIEAGTLDRAIDLAHERAAAGDTILLSPACASYDQFTSFEARGDAFRHHIGTVAGPATEGSR